MNMALGCNGTTANNKTATGDGGFLLQWNLHNGTSGWSGNIWVFDPVGTGITRTMGQGQAYANGTAEGEWGQSFWGTGGTTSAVSLRFYVSSGTVGDASVDATATLYGLAES
tara:strand:- start:677 stop:1012 length:336 start_codon:yes stop_codon:yes gene_type:complete